MREVLEGWLRVSVDSWRPSRAVLRLERDDVNFVFCGVGGWGGLGGESRGVNVTSCEVDDCTIHDITRNLITNSSIRSPQTSTFQNNVSPQPSLHP